MNEDTHGYLQQQSAEGELHSTGRFTLDPVQALEKLRNYQIGSPYRYGLFLVQTATMRRAEWVSLGIEETESSDVFICCPSLTSIEFDQLLTPFQEKCSADVFKLVLAIESVCRMGHLTVKEIQVESGGKLLVIRPDGVRRTLEDTFYTPSSHSVPPMPDRFDGIIFRVFHRLFSGFYLSGMTTWHQGLPLKYGGIPIYHGEQLKTQHLRRPKNIFAAPPQNSGRGEHHQIELPLFPDEKTYQEIYFVATQWAHGLIPGPRIRESERQQWWVFSQPDQPHLEITTEQLQSIAAVPWLDFNNAPALACYAYFGKFGTRSNCQIHWIQHGVLICSTEHSPQEFDLGWRGVVYCDDLPSDLSGSRLIEGEAYRVRLEWLKIYLGHPKHVPNQVHSL